MVCRTSEVLERLLTRGFLSFAVCLLLATTADADKTRDNFASPPLAYAPRPLWFWNDTPVDSVRISEQMKKARDLSGYGGFGILPFGKGFAPECLSDNYFAICGQALETALELGMTMCIYDEFGYPSGSAGAQNGDGIPLGRFMAVVAMESQTKLRLNLTDQLKDGRIVWRAPEGEWKLMIFVCVKDSDPNVDCLCPEALSFLVEMTHGQFYQRFKEYFGTTINATFHDEPTMYRSAGRIWMFGFNEKFRAGYGFDPAP